MRGGTGPAATMLAVVVLAALALHALLQSLLCDFGDGCSAAELGGLYLLWLVPVGYAVAVFGLGRRRATPPASSWPWAVSAGLIAVSVLVASCFAVVWT